MEIDQPTTIMRSVVAVDHANISYRVCSVCERTLSEIPASFCKYCNFSNSFNPRTSELIETFSNLTRYGDRLGKVKYTEEAAKVLFGCSADEFFDFAKAHLYAAMAAGQALTRGRDANCDIVKTKEW